MRYSFNKDFFTNCKYIKTNHKNILMYLYQWIFSSDPPESKVIDNKKYFYFSYKHMSEDLNINYRTLQNNLSRLKGDEVNDVKFIDIHYQSPSENRNAMCFIWVDLDIAYKLLNNDIYLKYINNLRKEEGVKNMNEPLFDVKESVTKIKKYSKECEDLVIDFLESHRNIFVTRVPADLNNPSKTFENACKKVQDIYNGNFYKSRMYHFSPDFEENKQFDVTDWRLKVKDVKGDWKKVRELLEKAINNFELMFQEDRMPFKKDYLQDNLDKWLFDDFSFGKENATSQFIQSLNEPMFTRAKLSENKADRIFNELPSRAKEGGNKIFEMNKNMSSGAFWEHIQEIVEWGQNVINFDDSAHCWIEKASEIPGKFADYLEEHDIQVSLNTVDIKHSVDCNAPWCWFVQEVCEKHGLNKDLVSCVTGDDFYDCYSENRPLTFDDMDEVIF